MLTKDSINNICVEKNLVFIRLLLQYFYSLLLLIPPISLSLALSSALLWACLFHLLWLFHPLASLLRLTFHASLCMCERLFCPYIYCIRFWFRLITNWHEVIVCYCTIYILCAKQINPSNAVWLHLLIVGNIKCIEI